MIDVVETSVEVFGSGTINGDRCSFDRKLAQGCGGSTICT